MAEPTYTDIVLTPEQVAKLAQNIAEAMTITISGVGTVTYPDGTIPHDSKD
jgi:hypothetical protein